MRHHKVTSLTTTTGERYIVDEQRSPSTIYGKGQFMIIFQDDLSKAAMQLQTATALRVYIALIPKLDFVLWRKVNQKALAAELHTSQGNISDAMAELFAQKIVEREGSGAHITWRFSMHWGWRGTPAQYHAELRRRGLPAPSTTTSNDQPAVAEGILWNSRRPKAAAMVP